MRASEQQEAVERRGVMASSGGEGGGEGAVVARSAGAYASGACVCRGSVCYSADMRVCVERVWCAV